MGHHIQSQSLIHGDWDRHVGNIYEEIDVSDAESITELILDTSRELPEQLLRDSTAQGRVVLEYDA